MILTINGKIAAIKKDCVFEYVTENRDFTASDSYTLSIELPLRGCPQNISIFGYLNRKDCPLNTNLFNATLQDIGFYKRGTIIITEINDVYVKVQFLEGKAQQNNDVTLQDIYINELELGSNTYIGRDEGNNPDEYSHNKSTWPADMCMNDIHTDEQEFQALPWVNNYSGNEQNKMNLTDETPTWAEQYGELSWQIYLVSLTQRIFQAAGYTYDLDVWFDHDTYDQFLLVCNTLPAAWGSKNIADALPHWTLQEYLEQLEALLQCEFIVDFENKHIVMKYKANEVADAGVVVLENILQEFSVKQDETAGQTYLQTYKYAATDNNIWKWADCQWLIDEVKRTGKYVTYATMQSMLNAVPIVDNTTSLNIAPSASGPGSHQDGTHSTWEKKVLYVTEKDCFFGVRQVWRKDTTTTVENGTRTTHKIGLAIMPLNLFAPAVVSEKADTFELKIVPVWIEDTVTNEVRLRNNFQCIFLDCGEKDDVEKNPLLEDRLESGQQKQTKQEVFDKIYVGYWSRSCWDMGTKGGGVVCPEIQPVNVTMSHKTFAGTNDLLLSKYSTAHKRQMQIGYCYEFQWLGNSIPNPRAIFLIHGKRYLCEKIVATFSDKGMSQLLKGTFYRIEEEQ